MLMRRWLPVIGVVGVLLIFVAVPAGASTVPGGERVFGKDGVEPANNAETGSIGYILVPGHAPDPVKADPRSWAPIYLPVYPVSAAGAVGTLICQHTPVENCPSHGDGIAGLAQAVMPSVHGAGVLGHDHVLDFPGGQDFNVTWEPIVVLFTSSTAANEHITTDAQIAAAVARGDSIEIPLPQRTFDCAPSRPASTTERRRSFRWSRGRRR